MIGWQPDPDEDAIHQGIWLVGQVAVGRPMAELTDIVYVNDHVVLVSLPDIKLRARDGETWAWRDTATGALTLCTSQEAVDQVRMVKALARREAARQERGDPSRWDFTKTRYATYAWELNRLPAGHRARAIWLMADRHWHLGNKLKGSKDVNKALEERCAWCVWKGTNPISTGCVGTTTRR